MFGFKRAAKRAIRKQVKQVFAPAKAVEEKVSTNRTSVSSTPKTQPLKHQPSSMSGTCHVIDGDTIVIGKQKVRFAGMNAPELNEPYGKQAKCFLPDGRDLAAEMVKMELALDIPHFPNADYKEFETPNSRRKLNWNPKKK